MASADETTTRTGEQGSDALGLELREIAIRAADGDLQSAGILQRRLGWDGGGIRSWQELARDYRLSTDQLRRCVERCTRRLQETRIFSPLLDEALTVINLNTMSSAADVRQQLVDFGLVRPDFDIRGIHSAGEALGKKTHWALVRGPSGDLIADAARRDHMIEVDRAAAKLLGRNGVADVGGVLEEIGDRTMVAIDAVDVHAIINARSGFRWLPGLTGWFWEPGNAENSLLKNMAKILAVAPDCATGVLRQGLIQSGGAVSELPPDEVLTALREHAIGGLGADASVRDRRPADQVPSLSSDERALQSVFMEHGKILRKSQIQAAWFDMGRDVRRLETLLKRSPVVEQLTRGIYTLIGTDVAPGLVEHLQRNAVRERQILDYGWNQDGRIWIQYSVTHLMLLTGTLQLPAGMAPFLVGDFVIDEEGHSGETVRCTGSKLRECQIFLINELGTRGARFSLYFDLVGQRVSLEREIGPHRVSA